MDKLFGEYFRLVDPDPNEAKLKKRWTGIERFTKTHGVPKVLDLARLFFSAPTRGTNFAGEFRDAFHAADSAFPMRGNALELSVLAGSCLKELFGSTHRRTADLSALAMVCAAASGHGRRAAVTEVLELAAIHLNEREPASSSLPVPSKVDLGQLQLKAFTEKMTEAGKAASLVPGLAAVLANFAQNVHKLIAQVVEANTTTSAAFARRLTLQEEETNILWWIFGEHSRDLGRPYGELDEPPAATVLIGKELADLVEIMPGPVASRAFLHRMLRSAKLDPASTTQIATAVGGLPLEWRRLVGHQPEFNQIDDFCPVLSAVQASGDLPESTAWLPAHAERTGVALEASFSTLDLCVQTYRECLLLKLASSKL